MRLSLRLAATLSCSVLAFAALQAVPAQAQTASLPERVIVNLTETPSTSLAFNWRAEAGAGDSFIEYAILTPGPPIRPRPFACPHNAPPPPSRRGTNRTSPQTITACG